MFASYSDLIIAPMRNRKTRQDILDSSITSNLKLSIAIVFAAVMFWLLFPATFYQFQAGAQRAALAATNQVPYSMPLTLKNEDTEIRGTKFDVDTAFIINAAGGAPTVLAGEVFSLLLNRG